MSGKVLHVTVVYATAAMEAIVGVDLPDGSTVADAVTGSRLLERHHVDAATLSCAIHGERVDPATPLADGDRVELLRPLVADPKDARRRRAQEKPLPAVRPQVKRQRQRRMSGE